MRNGDIVMIYDDVITREYPEGSARLLRKESVKGLNPETWLVQFLDGLEPRRRTRRIWRDTEGDREKNGC